MSLGYQTGRAHVGPCESCGTEVTHTEYKTVPGGPFYSASHHEAPCGLVCMNGGARGNDEVRALREGQVHRKNVCPRCWP